MRQEFAFMSHGKQEKIISMEQNRPTLCVWYACMEQPWTYSYSPCTYCSVTQGDFSRDEAKNLSSQTNIPVQEMFRNPPDQDITNREESPCNRGKGWSGTGLSFVSQCPPALSIFGEEDSWSWCPSCIQSSSTFLKMIQMTTCIETSQACDSHESSLWSFPGVISKAPCGSGDICWLWRWWETSCIIVLSLL